jgi:hypothetical protein
MLACDINRIDTLILDTLFMEVIHVMVFHFSRPDCLLVEHNNDEKIMNRNDKQDLERNI